MREKDRREMPAAHALMPVLYCLSVYHVDRWDVATARRRFWRVARAHPRALLMPLFWIVLVRTWLPVALVKWVRGMWMRQVKAKRPDGVRDTAL